MEAQLIIVFELAVLGHVLIRSNLEEVGTGLLAFQEHNEKGHTSVLALLVDTFRALNIVGITRSSYLEYNVPLLQIWFMEHIIAADHL